MIRQHAEFEIKPCGFFVDSNNSYIGATPDGLIKCKCCGTGVLEIKCPYCAKEADTLNDIADFRKQFCLQNQPSGLQLSRNHQYYMQCQLQMHVTKHLYCDFVVWNRASIHIERLEPDNILITEALEKPRILLTCAFYLSLPENGSHNKEILAKLKYHHRIMKMKALGVIAESHKEVMVGCDNEKCAIKWFHLSCLGMSEAPSGKWICPTCHPAKKQKVLKMLSK